VTAPPLPFPHALECCACHSSARVGAKREDGSPVMLSINLTIYRRGHGKGVHRAARRVVICEECFIKARVGGMFGPSKEARALSTCVLESLSGRYNAILEEGQTT